MELKIFYSWQSDLPKNQNLNFIETSIKDEVDSDTRLLISQSIRKLAATAQAYASDSFLETYITSVMRATGFKRVLLDRMVHSEIDEIVKEHRS